MILADEVTALVSVRLVGVPDDLVGVEQTMVLELFLERLLGRAAKTALLVARTAFFLNGRGRVPVVERLCIHEEAPIHPILRDQEQRNPGSELELNLARNPPGASRVDIDLESHDVALQRRIALHHLAGELRENPEDYAGREVGNEVVANFVNAEAKVLQPSKHPVLYRCVRCEGIPEPVGDTRRNGLTLNAVLRAAEPRLVRLVKDAGEGLGSRTYPKVPCSAEA